jgi:hypothetical protein
MPTFLQRRAQRRLLGFGCDQRARIAGSATRAGDLAIRFCSSRPRLEHDLPDHINDRAGRIPLDEVPGVVEYDV